MWNWINTNKDRIFLVFVCLTLAILVFSIKINHRSSQNTPTAKTDSLYIAKSVEYKFALKQLQGRIDSLSTLVDSLKSQKQKIKIVYEKKADNVRYWNSDSTTKFWAAYFER